MKRCRNNNKDEDNSPKTLNKKNHQASSQKFRQLASSRMVVRQVLPSVYSFTFVSTKQQDGFYCDMTSKNIDKLSFQLKLFMLSDIFLGKYDSTSPYALSHRNVNI